jgi:hypothetical protein
MLTLAMLTFRMLTGTKIGDYVATRGFGVCDTSAWRNGIFVVGALFCLIVMAYLSLRIYLWYRDDLETIFILPKGAV